jgi:hypothetical protein
MKTTLFCHFLNEELLLPGWLNHHKKLFSHGVMLDWGCTDNSVDIIREICPTWEIVNFQPADNRHNACTWKIEQLESMHQGWKMALNVSEYLIVDNLERFLTEFEMNNPNSIGLRTTGIYLVDDSGDNSPDSFRDINMISRMRYGYVEYGKCWDNVIHPDGSFATIPQSSTHYEGLRNRLIHKNIVGCYNPGRHQTRIPALITPDIYTVWVGRGSPELYYHKVCEWNKAYANGEPRFHNIDLAAYGLEFYKRFWKFERSRSIDLFENVKNYKMYIDTLYGINHE